MERSGMRGDVPGLRFAPSGLPVPYETAYGIIKGGEAHVLETDFVRRGAGVRGNRGRGGAGYLLSASVGRLSARCLTGARRQGLVLRPAARRPRRARSQDWQGRAHSARIELVAA